MSSSRSKVSSRHYGIDVELARVCSRDPEQAEAHGVSDLFTLDYHDIVNDPDIDIVIELIGGTTVARDVVVSALEAGKNVVTANKALMATHGEEVMHLAEKMNRELAFEASVGGGIPIIDPLKHSLISVSALDNFMSINNAVDLDLFGQVNAESAGIKHISGAGGSGVLCHEC